REIDDGRRTTQIVHDYPTGGERNFDRLFTLMRWPVAQRLQLLNRDAVFADIACNAFQDRAQGKRQIIQVDAEACCGVWQAVKTMRRAWQRLNRAGWVEIADGCHAGYLVRTGCDRNLNCRQ